MKEEEIRRLRVNRVELVKDLDVKYVLDHLIASFTFDIDDDERIRAEKTRQDRAARLLNLLEKSTNPNAYPEFRKALEEPYPHLVEKLDQTIVQNIGVTEKEEVGVGVKETENGRALLAYTRQSKEEQTDTAGGAPNQAVASGGKANVTMKHQSQSTRTTNVADIKGRGNFVIMGGQNTTINIKSKAKKK